MKHLFKFLIFFSLLTVGCEDKELDYVVCGWLRIDGGNTNDFYQVGNNGSPIEPFNLGVGVYGDFVKECNYIHLYKDDDEVDVERTDGTTKTIDLSNKDYEYGKL
jgi:hypothetical protein